MNDKKGFWGFIEKSDKLFAWFGRLVAVLVIFGSVATAIWYFFLPDRDFAVSVATNTIEHPWNANEFPMAPYDGTKRDDQESFILIPGVPIPKDPSERGKDPPEIVFRQALGQYGYAKSTVTVNFENISGNSVHNFKLNFGTPLFLQVDHGDRNLTEGDRIETIIGPDFEVEKIQPNKDYRIRAWYASDAVDDIVARYDEGREFFHDKRINLIWVYVLTAAFTAFSLMIFATVVEVIKRISRVFSAKPKLDDQADVEQESNTP